MRKLKTKSERRFNKSKKKQATVESPSVSKTVSKKEKQALKKQAARQRQEIIKILIPTFTVSLALACLLFLLKKPQLAIAGGGGLLALILSYKYPRQALWFFLIYMPISGTVTYAIGKGNALFQLAKDAFYFPALIALVQDLKKQRLPLIIAKELKQPLYILLAVCLLTLVFVNGIQQFAPACSSLPDNGKGMICRDKLPLALGLLGLKVFMGYIPLITCAYYLIRNKKEFLFLTRLHVVLALICCGLGLLQYFLLLTGRCAGTRYLSGAELFKANLNARCLVGGSLAFSPQVNMIRLPGTFVSPWHWAWFLLSNTFLTFASAFGEPSLPWQIASFAALASVVINAIICGQRIALVVVPICIVILLIFTGQFANWKRFLPIVGGIGIIIAIAIVRFPDVIQKRVESFIARWHASPPIEFILNQVQFTAAGQTGLLGKGIGRATNSARIFGETLLIETWFPKVFYEIGPIGLAGFLIFVTSLTIITFKAYKKLREPHLRSFAASFWLFILFISYNPYWYPLDTDPVAVYYWFFAGVLLKLPQIEQQEEEKENLERKDKTKKRYLNRKS